MTTLIFDLDETLIDSKHRTPNNPDGTLNLPAYIERHTPENVFKDTLLPLMRMFKAAINRGYKVAICTARDMKECDYVFLEKHGIVADVIMSRDKADAEHYKLKDGDYKLRWLQKLGLDKAAIMVDDSSHVKQVLRKAGIKVLCAHKLNARFGD